MSNPRGCGCASFLWVTFIVFLVLLGLVLIAAEPWLLILGVMAFVIGLFLFISYQLGRVAIRYPLIALLIIGVIALIAFLQKN